MTASVAATTNDSARCVNASHRANGAGSINKNSAPVASAARRLNASETGV